MSTLLTTDVASSEDRLHDALELARGGRAAEMRRDLSAALSRYEEARSLLAEADPTPLYANLLRWSGSVLRDLGRVDEADKLYSDSFHVADRTGAIAAKASALNCRAVIAQRRGDLDEATALYRRAARHAMEGGEIRLAGMIEQNLGVLANIRGDLDGALVRYRAALRAFQEVSDDEAVSWVLNNMGMLLNDLGLPLRAEKSFLQGLEIAAARRDRPMEGVLRANYSESLIALKRWDVAATQLDQALAIARAGDDRARVGEALKFRGVLERERGEIDIAGALLDAALAIGEDVSDPLLIAESLRERGELRRRKGMVDEALDDWEAARRGFKDLHATLDANNLTVRMEALLDQVRRAHWTNGASPNGASANGTKPDGTGA
ncbi:MAG: tetratricopeptide repeat protein [Gemmatimonadales bacterium]